MKIARRFLLPYFWYLLFFSFILPLHAQEYVLLGWNDLGMHCSNKDFAKVVVLPPFNNVSAQLILKLPNQLPQIVTSGYTIDYSIPNNTYSVGKTNFWTYAQQLFNLSSPLPPNIGLTGKGLTGELDSSGNFFAAHGIPVTPFADSDHVNEAPFQLIHITAKNKSSGTVLASTDVVIPVSNEVGCVQSGCHSSENSILNSHPGVTGFNRSGPVLCASCHASNALGTTGIPEAGPFSLRIHEKHSGVAGPSNSISTCYKCHPGPKTQCLRDIMGKNPSNPMVCQDCHGTMANVAATVDAGRRPWLDEPKCGNCHGTAYAEQPGKLYRQSQGHGGLFCSACHGSPHAIQPTVQANDNLQNIRLQGTAGTLRKCSVCHLTAPGGSGPHGIVDTTSYQPNAPLLASPLDGVFGITKSPQLNWNVATYSQSYAVQVSSDSMFAAKIIDDSLLTQTSIQIGGLSGGQKYFWHVRSKNSNGYSAWSDLRRFTTATGSTYSYAVDKNWNMVSLPIAVDNPNLNIQFPSAVSNLFEFSAGSGYRSKDSLINGHGYWLKFTTPQPINLTGARILSDSINVEDGWNMIGSISDSVPVAGIVTEPPDLISSLFFGYNVGYTTSDVIAPSKAYWVKTKSVGKIILSKAPKSAAVRSANNFNGLLQSGNAIVINDAFGHSQALYLVDRSVEYAAESIFEMPPPPPDGVFDVRFCSNRIVEILAAGNSKRFPIQVSSAEYPLSVSWNFQPTPNAVSLKVGEKEIPLRGSGTVLIENPESPMAVQVIPAAGLPSEFTLDQNYPNPFNPATVFRFGLPEQANVKLSIVDMLGQTVQVVTSGQLDAGYHEVQWTAALASGLYFYRLEAASVTDAGKAFSQVKKMILLK